jgi:hypothetical protein
MNSLLADSDEDLLPIILLRENGDEAMGVKRTSRAIVLAKPFTQSELFRAIERALSLGKGTTGMFFRPCGVLQPSFILPSQFGCGIKEGRRLQPCDNL